MIPNAYYKVLYKVQCTPLCTGSSKIRKYLDLIFDENIVYTGHGRLQLARAAVDATRHRGGRQRATVPRRDSRTTVARQTRQDATGDQATHRYCYVEDLL